MTILTELRNRDTGAGRAGRSSVGPERTATESELWSMASKVAVIQR